MNISNHIKPVESYLQHYQLIINLYIAKSLTIQYLSKHCGGNILVLSTSYHCSKQSRAQTNRNQITMDILPTDDPT